VPPGMTSATVRRVLSSTLMNTRFNDIPRVDTGDGGRERKRSPRYLLYFIHIFQS
jgi:hypothetical protein